MNKEYTVKIQSVSSDGSGVAHIDTLAVFVPCTVTGDVVKIRIDEERKSYALASVAEIIEPSPLRVKPQCAYFGKCGGCQLRHIEYGAQLEIKKGIVESSMRRIGGFKDFDADFIAASPDRERYRNKLVFPVGFSDGKAVCGFFAPKSRDIIPIDDCLLGDEVNSRVAAAVTEYMDEARTDAVKRIFTRVTSRGEVMVVICADTRKIPRRERLVSKLRRASDRIVSIVLNVNKRSNFAVTDDNITLWGSDEIHETLCELDFAVSPQSFLQVNMPQARRLYEKTLEYADIDENDTVFDIYCGIGTISLCAAKKAGKVIGIEYVEGAVKDARRSAERNNICNAEFYAGAAEEIVPRLIGEGIRPDVVILDPPRKGSDKKTLGAILKAAPKRIVYVSCDSATLARDARYLADGGYEITATGVFDMFPHTSHVETVVAFSQQRLDNE